jgi:hypothetical protein
MYLPYLENMLSFRVRVRIPEIAFALRRFRNRILL